MSLLLCSQYPSTLQKLFHFKHAGSPGVPVSWAYADGEVSANHRLQIRVLGIEMYRQGLEGDTMVRFSRSASLTYPDSYGSLEP